MFAVSKYPFDQLSRLLSSLPIVDTVDRSRMDAERNPRGYYALTWGCRSEPEAQ